MAHPLRSIALAAAVIAFASCEADPFAIDAQDGTIQVTVVRGPIHPVEQAGQPNVEPVNGARVSARASSGDVVRTTSTNAFGVATFQVGAGAWNVSVDVCPGALGTPLPATVRVPAGGFAVAAFECDTGIR